MVLAFTYLLLALLISLTLYLANKTELKISFTPMWFMIIHFWLYVLVGFFFPGPDLSEDWWGFVAAVGSLAFVSSLIGFLLTSGVLERTGKVKLSVKTFPSFAGASETSLVMAFLFIIVCFGFLSFGGLPPILKSAGAFFGGALDLSASVGVRDFRFEMTKSAYFGGESKGQGIFRTLIFIGCAVSCAYFAYNFACGRSKSSLYGLVFSIAVSFIYVAGIGARGPFLEVLMISACSYSLARPFGLGKILLSSVLVLVTFLFLSALSTKGAFILSENGLRGVPLLVDDLISRIFRGNSQYDIEVIKIVEQGVWDLRLGKGHIRNFVTSLPGINFGIPVAYELFQFKNPFSYATTFLSGSYLMIVYLDFGFFGVIPAYFLLGSLIAICGKAVFWLWHRSHVEVAFGCVLSFLLGKTVLFGPYGFLATLFVLLFYYAIFQLARSLRLFRKPKHLIGSGL